MTVEKGSNGSDIEVLGCTARIAMRVSGLRVSCQSQALDQREIESWGVQVQMADLLNMYPSKWMELAVEANDAMSYPLKSERSPPNTKHE